MTPVVESVHLPMLNSFTSSSGRSSMTIKSGTIPFALSSNACSRVLGNPYDRDSMDAEEQKRGEWIMPSPHLEKHATRIVC